MTDHEKWAKILHDHGIKPSYPRLRIYSYLAQTQSHPTADEIYAHLSREMPTLSKMTVYNTLNVLIEKKLARLICIEEHEARYDADASLHGHFKCLACQKVYDFPVIKENLPQNALDGCLMLERDVFYRGFCKNCN